MYDTLNRRLILSCINKGMLGVQERERSEKYEREREKERERGRERERSMRDKFGERKIMILRKSEVTSLSAPGPNVWGIWKTFDLKCGEKCVILLQSYMQKVYLSFLKDVLFILSWHVTI